MGRRCSGRWFGARSSHSTGSGRHSVSGGWARSARSERCGGRGTSSGHGSRADIDAGRLSMVGLVRHSGLNPFHLTQSHQVLAYAYEVEGDAVTLRIYDPNWPGRDDVMIHVDGDHLEQSSAEELVGTIRLP